MRRSIVVAAASRVRVGLSGLSGLSGLRVGVGVCVAIGSSGALFGCGGVQYAVEVNSAASRVSEAKALGAEQLAPYEYYFAKEHLEQAQIEAAEASYSDATNLAEEAEDHASAAIEATQKARRVTP